MKFIDFGEDAVDHSINCNINVISSFCTNFNIRKVFLLGEGLALFNTNRSSRDLKEKFTPKGRICCPKALRRALERSCF